MLAYKFGRKNCPPSPASGGNPPEPTHLAFQLLSSLPRPSCTRNSMNAANTENRQATSFQAADPIPPDPPCETETITTTTRNYTSKIIPYYLGDTDRQKSREIVALGTCCTENNSNTCHQKPSKYYYFIYFVYRPKIQNRQKTFKKQCFFYRFKNQWAGVLSLPVD